MMIAPNSRACKKKKIGEMKRNLRGEQQKQTKTYISALNNSAYKNLKERGTEGGRN